MTNLKKKAMGISAAGLLALTLTTAPAWGFATGMQGVLDSITQGGPSSVNASTDFLGDSGDSVWSIGGSGGSVSTIVIELAGNLNTNTFGIYDIPSMTQVELFSGTQNAGDQGLLSIHLDGSVFLNFADTGIDFASNHFGFYLGTADNGTFYSDTAKNTDEIDHLAAYQGVGDTIQLPGLAPGIWGNNEYILGWEDLKGGGDMDHNDFVVLVESVNPVPEPGTIFLFGSGLMGLAAWRMRKNKANK